MIKIRNHIFFFGFLNLLIAAPLFAADSWSMLKEACTVAPARQLALTQAQCIQASLAESVYKTERKEGNLVIDEGKFKDTFFNRMKGMFEKFGYSPAGYSGFSLFHLTTDEESLSLDQHAVAMLINNNGTSELYVAFRGTKEYMDLAADLGLACAYVTGGEDPKTLAVRHMNHLAAKFFPWTHTTASFAVKAASSTAGKGLLDFVSGYFPGAGKDTSGERVSKASETSPMMTMLGTGFSGTLSVTREASESIFTREISNTLHILERAVRLTEASGIDLSQLHLFLSGHSLGGALAEFAGSCAVLAKFFDCTETKPDGMHNLLAGANVTKVSSIEVLSLNAPGMHTILKRFVIDEASLRANTDAHRSLRTAMTKIYNNSDAVGTLAFTEIFEKALFGNKFGLPGFHKPSTLVDYALSLARKSKGVSVVEVAVEVVAAEASAGAGAGSDLTAAAATEPFHMTILKNALSWSEISATKKAEITTAVGIEVSETSTSSSAFYTRNIVTILTMNHSIGCLNNLLEFNLYDLNSF